MRYFFTWNVNEFVIFDRKLFDRPLLERRVRPWRLGRYLADSAAVAREDNLNFIKTHFLPDLLRGLADILSGRRAEWLPPGRPLHPFPRKSPGMARPVVQRLYFPRGKEEQIL